MSPPLSADRLLAALRKWKVPVEQHLGWRTHNRNQVGAWGPVNGLMLHHTGDDAPDSVDEKLLWNGRSDLPGPLTQWGMRDDGTLVLVGNGRCNHAGWGSERTFDRVVAEDYTGNLTPTGPENVDGNSHFYGQETMYSGGHRMTAKAYRSTVRAFAAVCDAHGWTSKSCIGHKEWTHTKIDPGHLDMTMFRADVEECLRAGPGNWPAPKPPADTRVTRFRAECEALLVKYLDPAVAAGRTGAVKTARDAIRAQLARLES